MGTNWTSSWGRLVAAALPATSTLVQPASFPGYAVLRAVRQPWPRPREANGVRTWSPPGSPSEHEARPSTRVGGHGPRPPSAATEGGGAEGAAHGRE